MQIKTGTASVTNGSNRVIFSTADLSAITLQAIFSLDAVIGAPIYSIVDVRKPAASPAAWTNSASGLWEIFLAVNYAQATNATAAFLVHKDFETVEIAGVKYDFALFEVTDTQTLPLINRNTVTLANFLRAILARPIYLWNAEQSKFFPIAAFGPAGEEVIGISGPGVP
jgi:hypothetical protein